MPSRHSEKLAMAFGLARHKEPTSPGPQRVNICSNCHLFANFGIKCITDNLYKEATTGFSSLLKVRVLAMTSSDHIITSLKKKKTKGSIHI